MLCLPLDCLWHFDLTGDVTMQNSHTQRVQEQLAEVSRLVTEKDNALLKIDMLQVRGHWPCSCSISPLPVVNKS